ncbi:YbbC/YhhH family protein [Rufibacter tibetensis]|uniref:YbbC/YhhH family protein n=1 Tax=Rufibacter tibetensis TaxID=512763 RepID=UPI000A8A1775|nr:YbbC/YhhH family protein [Rufibacter tibetensis]
MKEALLIFFCCFILSCSFAHDGEKRTILGLEFSKKELDEALKNTDKKQIFVDKVIKDKSTAIGVAEAMLFSIYGKENIVKQRPYEYYLIDGYWVINGTLPQGWVGGTFLIIINSTDGKVIKLTHGK